MKTILLYFLFMFTPIWSFNRPVEYLEWELVKSEENIHVYTQSVPESNIKKLKIQFEVSAPLEKIVSVLGDVKGYTDWVYKCSISKTVKTFTKNELIYYSVTDFPFPFDDRDIYIYSIHEVDFIKGSYYSKSVADTTYANVENGMVRMNNFGSEWNITRIGKDKFTVDYRNLSDPAGAIPQWMVNIALAHGPFETMKRFKHLVEKS